jgi:hypothetical protein
MVEVAAKWALFQKARGCESVKSGRGWHPVRDAYGRWPRARRLTRQLSFIFKWSTAFQAVGRRFDPGLPLHVPRPIHIHCRGAVTRKLNLVGYEARGGGGANRCHGSGAEARREADAQRNVRTSPAGGGPVGNRGTGTGPAPDRGQPGTAATDVAIARTVTPRTKAVL